MRRRNFLKIAGLSAVAGALPSAAAYSLSLEDALVGVIKNQFSFLRLDEKGVRQFVADYYATEGASKTLLAQAKMKAFCLLKLDSEQSQTVRGITTVYLISTDFFQNKMDESRLVKYQGLYNPHKTPCANPFSSLYYPPAVS